MLAIDVLFVNLLDEVTFLQSSLSSRAARNHLGDPGTLVRTQILLPGEFLRHHLEADPEEWAFHSSELG